MVHGRELRIVYVPEARIRNSWPDTLGEFLAVRRRNAAAHWSLRRREGYEVATWPAELLARGLGVLDGLLAPERHIRWRIARSARVRAGEAHPA